MASVFSNVFGSKKYNKFGPGVTKENTEGSVAKFFRILKSKFWKMCTLNLLLTACMIPIIAASFGIYSALPLSDTTATEEFLNSNELLDGRSVSYDFRNIINKYCSAYQLSEKAMTELNIELSKIIITVDKVNPDLLTDGISEFDMSKYSDEVKEEVRQELSAALEVIGPGRFSITFDNDEKCWKIIDTVNDYILTTAYFNDGKMSINDYIAEGYTDYFYWALVLLPLVLLGPVLAGIVRVTRDFVREEPVFLFSDFMDTIKKNWKQSLVISFVFYLVSVIIVNAVSIYYSFINNGWLYLIAFAASLMLGYIFISMHFYILLMQVTLKLGLKQIYKNAFFFSIICLFRNLLLIIGFAAALFLFYLLFILGQAIGLILAFMFLITVSFIVEFAIYIIIYVTYPPIKRIIIDPYYEEHKEETSEALKKNDDDNVSSTTQDDAGREETSAYDNEKAEEELPEYVYHNGRMVHRSALENDSLFKD